MPCCPTAEERWGIDSPLPTAPFVTSLPLDVETTAYPTTRMRRGLNAFEDSSLENLSSACRSGYRGSYGADLSNLAASIGTFAWISLSSMVDCPFVQVTVQ